MIAINKQAQTQIPTLEGRSYTGDRHIPGDLGCSLVSAGAGLSRACGSPEAWPSGMALGVQGGFFEEGSARAQSG